MRQFQVRRSVRRDGIWRLAGRWLHGDPYDVLRRVRLLKMGVVGVGALLAIAAMILAQASEASAKSEFLTDFNAAYDTGGTRLDTCSLCHVGSGFKERNEYGKAYKGDFAAIERLDSDGDGITNIAEIRALTFPGDPNDPPPPTTTTVPPTTTTVPPTTAPPTTTTTTTTSTVPPTTAPPTTTTTTTTSTVPPTTAPPTTTSSTTVTPTTAPPTSTTTTVTPTTAPPTTTTTAPPAGENHRPEARDDAYRTEMDSPIHVPPPGVIGNDNDDDGDALTARLGARLPVNGFVVFERDGSFTYVPDGGFVGEDGFSYRLFDGTEYSAEATVAITVEGPEPPSGERPEARNDSYRTRMDTPLEISAPGVLRNDGDHDDDEADDDDVEEHEVVLRARIGAKLPTHGTVTLNEDGSFTYVPDAGFVGKDRFTYQAFDGVQYSEAATVKIRVKPPARGRNGHAEAAKPTPAKANPNDKSASSGPLLTAGDVSTVGNDAVAAAKRVVVDAVLNHGGVATKPLAATARRGYVQAVPGKAISGEAVSAAAASLAQSVPSAGAESSGGEGFSPLAVVLLTLLISAGAFGLIMIAGEGRSGGRL